MNILEPGIPKLSANRTVEWQRLRAAAYVAAGFAVLAFYYRQIWRVFQIGPLPWVMENYSLAALYSSIYALFAGRGLPPFPALEEALARNLLAVSGAGLVLLFAQSCGFLIMRLARLEVDDRRTAFLYRTSLGLGGITYLSLGLAAVSQYHVLALRWILAAGAAAALMGMIFYGFRQRPDVTYLGRKRAPAGDRQLVWKALVGLALLLALTAALAPESEYDALWYHLWLPRLWLEAGGMVDPVVEYISLYPLHWELIFGAGLAAGGQAAAKLLHWACLPLTALGIYQLMRRFFPRSSPWLAVLLFVSIPTTLWEATTAYVDLALAFHTILALYALAEVLFQQGGRTWLWLAGINLGFALGTKHLALFLLLLCAAGLVLYRWRKERRPGQAVLPALALVAIALGLALPWYLRSYLASGNPVFPELYSIFGAQPAWRWSEITERGLGAFKNRFGDPRTPLNLLLLPWNMTLHPARYGGSLGPIFLLLLPGMFQRLPGRPAFRFLALFSAAYLGLWASPLSSFQMRFLVPLAPVLAILGALAFEKLAAQLSSLNIRAGLAKGVLAALILLNLPLFLSLHEGDREGDTGWLTHVNHTLPLGVVLGLQPEAEYLARKVPSYRAWQYINANLPLEARVLSFNGGDHFYGERGRVWSDAAVAFPAVWGARAGQEEEALAYLRELAITHVLVDQRLTEAQTLPILQPAVLQGYFLKEYEDERFVLYSLPEP